MDIINPANGKILYTYQQETYEDVLEKLNILNHSKSDKSIKDRCLILSKISHFLERDKNEIALLVSQETGKVHKDALGEIARAILTFKIASEMEHNIFESCASIDTKESSTYSFQKRFPIGTILCVTPFNFPINLAAHKIAPAFLAGNKILYKPADMNYKSCSKFYDILLEAGMQPIDIQITFPLVESLNKIVSGKEIQGISFTGGTATADKIASIAGRKKLLFELGGNAPLVIYPDFNIEQAVDIAIAGRFYMAGQKCTSNKKVYIHKSIFNNFKQRLLEKSKELVLGDPLNESTDIGPVINKESALIIKKRISLACEKGATILLGGNTNEAYVEPTIIENISSQDDLVVEETFGPIMPIFTFEDTDELIDELNQSKFGLQAGILTQDISIGKNFFENLETGTIVLGNGPGLRFEHLPFGGVKDSGNSREGIKNTFEEMTYLKQLLF